MQQITIVGLGLIGGSIGLGLRAWSEQSKNRASRLSSLPGLTLTSNSNTTRKIKAVDNTVEDLTKAVRSADIVIICTPVMAIRETFENIAPYLKAGAVVADAGPQKVL